MQAYRKDTMLAWFFVTMLFLHSNEYMTRLLIIKPDTVAVRATSSTSEYYAPLIVLYTRFLGRHLSQDRSYAWTGLEAPCVLQRPVGLSALKVDPRVA
jgi:hypothetical protein